MRLGKGKEVILSSIILLVSASLLGQVENNIKYQFNGDLREIYVTTGDQSITINYSISEVNIGSITNEHGSFYRISIPGHTNTTLPGKPELPVFSRLIAIPEGVKYVVKISDVISTKINPSGKKIKGILYPAQEGQTKGIQQDQTRFKMDKADYSSRDLISSDTVKIENLGKVRKSNLANLMISPVRYNPRSNVVEVITSMKVEITFSSSNEFESKSLLSSSSSFVSTLDKGILNYNPGNVVPGYSEQPLRMIIVTDSSFKRQLEPFIKWKTQKGFKLDILYKGTNLTGNTYTEIKDAITKIYTSTSEASPPPEYLLIIGDVTRIPYFGTGGTGNITDMYYGEFDGGGDYIPEMYIGRLPVSDTVELRTVVNKIIQYERFEFADTNKFYTRALATAGYDASYANTMNGQLKYLVNNYLTTTNRINEYHFYYPQSYTAKDSIINLISKGTSFINYTGHGDASGWLHINNGKPNPVYGIRASDFPLSKNMYPFIISNACKTSQYNLSSSFGNKLVVGSDKGAIGFIGCSNDSYWDEDFYWAVGVGPISSNPTYLSTGLGVFDRLFHTNGESPSERYYTMGQINYAGNLSVSASTSQRKKYYWETYNLVGDPTMIPVIGNPYHFDVTLPDTLPNGIKSFTFNIDPFSYVAVSHFDTLWDASFSSVTGSVTLQMPGLRNDSCLIVITGQNKYPVIKTVYFSDINGEYINLTSSSIIDVAGNNNGKADYGESVFLNLNISNLGLADANDLYVKISSTSDWVTITKDSAYIGSMLSLSEIALLNNLSMTISANVPDLELIPMVLTIKDKKIEKRYSIDIVAHSPELQILSIIIDDKESGNGDFIADPGETIKLIFKVRNQGTSNVLSGDLIITKAGDGITVLSSSVKSGVLKYGQITDIPVEVKISDAISSGSIITLSSQLISDPFLVNKDFSFRVGKVRESFESSSFSVFPWINVSSSPWTVSSNNFYEGSVSARSGIISNNGTSSLIIRAVYAAKDSVKFSYKVSSEADYDFFSFRLNNVEVLKKSGEIPWTKVAIAVPAGLNKMEWIYKKDQSKFAGSDCAWIDLIDFTGSGSVNYIKRDLQVTRIETPELKDKYGKETISVKVKNPGKDVFNGFTLAYSLKSDIPVVQFFDNIITSNDSTTVTFTEKADMSKNGIYSLVIYGTNNKDEYTANDTLKFSYDNMRFNEAITVFPNPFNENLSVFINSQVSEKVRITIISLAGSKFYDAERDVISGKNIFQINVPGLSPALYYLNIKGSLTDKTIPILKVNK